jgi:hypothetical protein
MYGADTIKEMIQKYGNGTGLVIIFLCCVIWIWGNCENEKKKYLMCYALGAAALLNSKSMQFLKNLGSGGTLYRFIWLLPMISVMAYVLTELFIKQKKTSDKICWMLFLICLLYFCGDTYLKPDKLQLPETVYGISQDTIDVSDIIEQEKQEEYVIVAMEKPLQLTIRQWNAFVICGITRESYITGIVDDGWFNVMSDREKEEQMLMRMVSNGEAFDRSAMKQCIQDRQIDFIVMNKKLEMEGYMQELDCRLVGENQAYEVYATGV